MRIGLQTSHANAIALGEAAAGGGGLDLPLEDWDGGSDYWSVAQNGDTMTRAEANGWNDPSFFPIAVWLSDPQHADELVAIGVNTYLGIFADPGAINTAAAAGVSIIPQANEWSAAEVLAETTGRDSVVGWLPHDEPELNLAFATYMTSVSNIRALDDGRFVLTNFCHGIRRTVYYAGSTQSGTSTEMFDAVGANDAACVDQYCYTSPGIRGDPGPQGICDNFNFPDLHNGTSYLWPGDYQDFEKVDQAAAYGWQAQALSSLYTEKGLHRPVWVAVETKMPFLSEANRDIVLYDEIRGAVWSAIGNGAKGILYFQHNGFYGAPGTTDPGSYPTIDPNTGILPDDSTMSLVDCEAALRTYISTLNAQITSLAPVLNTQSYVWDFSASGIETMLKVHDDFVYIFATKSVLGTTGSKTFTLPSGISGTVVTVVDEARTINVSGGQFSDTFANEYSHHIYRIPL